MEFLKKVLSRWILVKITQQKYDANGLLTKDYKPGTQEYNRMKMAEDALKNLSLDFLRFHSMC